MGANNTAELNADAVLMLDHVTGTQMELPLQSMGNGRMKLVHALDAGDPIFFKYVTGRPFPLGP